MQQYIGPQTRPLALCLAIGVAVCDSACHGSREASELAPSETHAVAVATGSLGISVSPGPRTRGAVPSGTALVLLSNVNVCASAYHPGDSFIATVADSSRSPNGDVIPAGSLATFRVTDVSRPSAGHPDTARIGIALDSLDIDGVRYPATAQLKSVGVRHVRLAQTTRDPPRTAGGMLGERLRKSVQPTGDGAGSARRSVDTSSLLHDVCIPRRGRITVALRP